MPYFNVWIDNRDVLKSLSDEDLLDELESRELSRIVPAITNDLQQLYTALASHDTTRLHETAREIIYRSLGRIVN